MSKKGVAGDWSLYYLLRSFYGVLAVTVFTKNKIRGFGRKSVDTHQLIKI